MSTRKEAELELVRRMDADLHIKSTEPAASGESDEPDVLWSAVLPTFPLPAIRAAVTKVIAEGDPRTPRDAQGRAVWSTEWLLYASGKAEAFVAEVERILTVTENGG